MNKGLSDLWQIPTPEGKSIGLEDAHKCQKPGKSTGLDSIYGKKSFLSKESDTKILESELYFPRVYTPHQVGSQILGLQFPYFMYAPTRNQQDLEKSTNSCNP